MKRTQTVAPARSTRTVRKRKVAEKVKKVDVAVIKHARQRRLDALEDDNFAAQQEAEILEGEDEYDLDEEMSESLNPKRGKRKRRAPSRKARSSATIGKQQGKGIQRWNKSFAQMVEEEKASERPAGMVTWEEIVARPSVRPARAFCSICGYKAAYTCRRCLVKFCSVNCGVVHKETRCLKFTV